jgi:hypothetical protein
MCVCVCVCVHARAYVYMESAYLLSQFNPLLSLPNLTLKIMLNKKVQKIFDRLICYNLQVNRCTDTTWTEVTSSR